MYEKISISDIKYSVCNRSRIYFDIKMHNLKLLIKKHLSHTKKIFIITDKNVANIYLKNFINVLKDGFEVFDIVLEPGELSKNIDNAINITNKILSFNVDKNSLIVAFGGGVIGDVAGFVASILLRGLNFIQVPTSLLAQVDSSIGGKTAVNTIYGKNLIGSFYHPFFVCIDDSFIQSLPDEEYYSAYGEIIKYGIIDKNIFNYLEKNIISIKQREPQFLKEIINLCGNLKVKIVNLDEKEILNYRKLLNLGHSFAHALEMLFISNNTYINHGYAVSVGIILAFKLSLYLDYSDQKDDMLTILNLMREINLPCSLKDLYKKNIFIDTLIGYMKHDKKFINGNLEFILPIQIGNVINVNNIKLVDVKKFLIQEFK